MQRPNHAIIFASTFIAILFVLWFATSVSAISAPPAQAAQLSAPGEQSVASIQDAAPPAQPTSEPAQVTTESAFFVPAPSIAEPAVPGPNTIVNPVYVRPDYVNDLDQFIAQVVPTTGGSSHALSGVFVQGIIALSINQQPPGDNNWVTEEENAATLFSAAAQHGVIGLLAHNTRAGRDFSAIQPGQRIQLVYADGSVRNFRLASSKSYQAIDPRSPTSDFVDLSTGEYLTAGDVFNRYYTGSFPLILQTCIEQNGDSFWGRLFLIGEPEE